MNTKESFKTVCCYCGVGCGVELTKLTNGRLALEGDKAYPVNKGALCSKGMNLHYTVMDQSDRLLYPEMRYARNMPRQKVSWDEALDRTAAVFKTFIEKYGPDSVGFYISGQCLTEEYYAINKLMKGFIGSNNIDTNSRLCMSSAVVGYKLSLGEDSVPVCYDDIELSDCVLVAGANPAWCHPILWKRAEAHKEKNPHVKIIVVDPRATDSVSNADLHLQIIPGTDVTLFNAIGRALIENGFADTEFIRSHTAGYEAYKNQVFSRTLEEAALICSIEAKEITEAAAMIGEAKGFLSMWAMGLNQSSSGVNKNLSLIDLHLITGKIGSPGNGPFSLTGQPNAMGGREVGGLANLLPAHRNLDNPAHRQEVQDFWGGKAINAKPGLTATEMFEALNDGRMKAIWIVCTNPMISMPDVAQVEHALKKAKFVVVQDVSNKSDTLFYADVVLPAAGWAEKEGTMTNAERRISYLPKIVSAPGEALPDVEIVCRFAQKMGFGHAFDYQHAGQIFEEHARLAKNTNINISGLTYEILQRERSVKWPYSLETGGTDRLFTDKKFYFPDGKARIAACPDENLSEAIAAEYPLIATTGRIRDQWHSMTKTAKVNKLSMHVPEPFLEMNPSDASERNLSEGRLVVVKSRRGEVKVKLKITDSVKPGTVFLPMHWGKILNKSFGRANNITNNLVDQRSKEPDFKYSAVQVAAYSQPPQKIIIIGAGAGALGFLKTYRQINSEDEIVVFSKEKDSFYNRVALPDYFSGVLQWDDLSKISPEELFDWNIRLYKGVGIEAIDRERKTVLDAAGNTHDYDKLVIATGSRAFMPPGVPIALPGVFNIRARSDADRLKALLQPGDSVVIAGAGLLGLEMAGAFVEVGLKVTVVNRTSRCMDRQLDETGSDLLHSEMIDLGAQIYYNDEIESFIGRDRVEGARLKSGQVKKCQAVVFAVGTSPNIELAKAAGLKCNRGVTVNEYLQTSDEHIFALGEVAEFQNQMWGITAAAEQQADIAARFLCGEEANYYKGSVSMNILKLANVQLCSIGMIAPPKDDPAYEEVIFIDKAKRYYKKCIVHNDRLVGAILIGDKSEFLEFKDLIQNAVELSEKRLQLLRSGAKAEPVIGKLVCSCNNVGAGNISRAISAGSYTIEGIGQKTGAGTGCGSCRNEIKSLLKIAASLAVN